MEETVARRRASHADDTRGVCEICFGLSALCAQMGGILFRKFRTAGEFLRNKGNIVFVWLPTVVLKYFIMCIYNNLYLRY